MFLLGILIFKGLTARRLCKSFGVKGLILSPKPIADQTQTDSTVNCHMLISNPNTGRDRLLAFQDVKATRISQHSVHEGGKLSPTHQPPLPP
jgi:hypothetical protein